MKNIGFLTRREFLKLSTLSLLALPVLSKLSLKPAWAQVPNKLVSESDPMAAALKYRQDATKVPVTERVKKIDVEGKDQFCSNCNFYKSMGEVDKVKAGECTLIKAGMVTEKGWCMTWTKKMPAPK